jgi:uncharacterized protein (TIGR04255 family)
VLVNDRSFVAVVVLLFAHGYSVKTPNSPEYGRRSLLALQNPPVTQTSIGFTFDPGDPKRPWNPRTALEFVDRVNSSLPHRDWIFQTRFDIKDASPDKPEGVLNHETILDHIRASNEERTSWLQVARDRLVCNRTRGEGAYLGYVSLRDEALVKLDGYVDFFRPMSLRSAELYYVDQIEIPIPDEKTIDLKQYFKLYIESPPEFGPSSYFSTRLFFNPPIEGDILEVKFQSEPPIPDASKYRFQIDWRMICSGMAAFDRESVGKRLDGAHELLGIYFKEIVTKQTWDLFQPSDAE